MPNKKRTKIFHHSLKRRSKDVQVSFFGKPSIYHALIIIFLEFFSWGLLTSPMIIALNRTFPQHTFLMNGIIQGIKGILSFFSAPMIGALSDLWGRKSFLLLTVFFTCCPIPLMKISPWWFFALISISGILSVTFSIVFAYVSDITTEENRAVSYGLVSATFAASLITSPAIGAYLEKIYSDSLVILLATAIALFDVFFILLVVPESLNYKEHQQSHHHHHALGRDGGDSSYPYQHHLKHREGNDSQYDHKHHYDVPSKRSHAYSSHQMVMVKPATASSITWENADPLWHIRRIGKDRTIMLLCITIFLSYLPESGQYSSFFVYLKLVMNFTGDEVAAFIAFVGILSVIAQTFILNFLMKVLGGKTTILVGLTFEIIQLAWYGFASQMWMMWSAGALASLSSITYPAISSYVSNQTDADKQGLVQGLITGIRGLCNGIGPALFGLIFYMFHVNLDAPKKIGNLLPTISSRHSLPNQTIIPESVTVQYDGYDDYRQRILPGPPYVFGSLIVMLAFLLALLIPENQKSTTFYTAAPKDEEEKNLFVSVEDATLISSKELPETRPLFS